MHTATDILVIDDESVILEAVAHILGAEGLSVETAQDGASALRALEDRRHRLVICDIMMPEIDGFQVLREAQRRHPDTPVIISTGFSTIENAVHSLSAGAIDFVPKPFTADELLSTVTRGLKYGEILARRSRAVSSSDVAQMYTVPCPTGHYRLGYMSWTLPEKDGTALLGVTHAFAQTIERISRISLIEDQEEVVQGMQCAQVGGGEGFLHPVLSPLSGTVIAKNAHLEHQTDIVEKDPYYGGWLYRIIPSNPEYELSQLTPCGSDRI